MRHEFIARLLCEMAQNRPARIFDLGSGQGDLLQKLDRLLPQASLLGAEMSQELLFHSARFLARHLS